MIQNNRYNKTATIQIAVLYEKILLSHSICDRRSIVGSKNMGFYKRYDKKTIESFAKNTISEKYDKKYSSYYSPSNSDNFDYISPSREDAIEITTAIPENEMNYYVFETQKAKGKSNLNYEKVKGLKLNANGEMKRYYGGSLQEIIELIYDRIESKQKKALTRTESKSYKHIDLCVCIQDGSLLDLSSFQREFSNLGKYIFDKIFFITPSHFIVYEKDTGLYER